ncbi:hypothetical protein DUNSADRAFT_15152 [Dunaliella salina]|uniref:Encoded protein n=1 Tax=Dunaliella salina TaxID=3046 RepID=A0ABQ7G5Z1_DUNSA|nr:hypothetical protein DUNSADRAFT_15152 [Dunaliella salina]|eukprot:KAF5830026.1 hypothetical protein DUNSADRAFT_15152 [Dunaliella salina]
MSLPLLPLFEGYCASLESVMKAQNQREQIQAQERVQTKTKESIQCCDALLVTLGEAMALKNSTNARPVHEDKDNDTDMADASGATSLQSFRASLLGLH